MSQTKTRVFELRTYTTNEGKLPDLQKRFREHTVDIFNRHGMTSVGYFTPEDKPNTLVYVLAFPSRDAATKSWAAFRDDAEWKKVSAASEANGKIVNHVDSVFMDPTDYSPMK
jgi:predicted GIY-YIG superfamily endonuclease